jgi:flagellar M-ring protein FliF
MNTAVAEVPVAQPAWSSGLSRLSTGQQMRLAGGVVLMLAIIVAAWTWGRTADYRVLFANLTDKDGGAIIAQLAQMNVPYKYTEGGGAIMVPADRVHDVRLRLASQGLPKGAIGGFEQMESNRFGMTQFQERLSFQRGLEGELQRSIQALSSVQGARVHLALPNQNGFFREQQKPSASVLLSLHPGRTLDRSQIAGIVHLVASSVPEMSPQAVSVLDDSGKLLSSANNENAIVDAEQLQYVQQIEQLYTRRILDILEPLVGRDNVKAQVTADVDFSQTEQTSETHKPNLGPDAAAVRSQQVVETNGESATPPTGVPGAVSNQPPAPAAAPINGQPAPLQAAGGVGATSAQSRREAVTNYEVDRTVRVVRGATGSVRRLSAAVVVNHATTEVRGKPTTAPLSAQQIEQMTALVRESIGFNNERGDSVNLMNAPFVVDKVSMEDVPLWRQPEVVDTARSFAWPLAMLGLAALVVLGMIRPAIKAMTVARLNAEAANKAAAGGQLDALVDGDADLPQLAGPARRKEAEGPTEDMLRLEDARALAKQNPVAVANIVKQWVSGEVAA